MDGIVVTEGVESVWFYHWSRASNQSRSLCGRTTMPTHHRSEDWGKPGGNVPAKYCRECAAALERLGAGEEA